MKNKTIIILFVLLGLNIVLNLFNTFKTIPSGLTSEDLEYYLNKQTERQTQVNEVKKQNEAFKTVLSNDSIMDDLSKRDSLRDAVFGPR